MIRLLPGDCMDVLPTLEADSIAACVTDPPYHLTSIVKRFGSPNAAPAQFGRDGAFARASAGFMGKQWDGGDIAFRPETWREVYRVLKPGAYLVAFGGTRTYHRMACAIEDAGFEVRDALMWLYGTGFPKSHDISKAIDKQKRRDYVAVAIELGAILPHRSVDDWTKEGHSPSDKWWQEFKAAIPVEMWQTIERQVIGRAVSGETAWFANGIGDITAPATPEAAQWSGWGTALKPAMELIVLARKPLAERTVAANVLKFGTGALNIDGNRIPFINEADKASAFPGGTLTSLGSGSLSGPGAAQEVKRSSFTTKRNGVGRWPANVVHDGSEEVEAAFAAFGDAPGQGGSVSGGEPSSLIKSVYGKRNRVPTAAPRTDAGTASRFFANLGFSPDELRFHYSGKADRADRADSAHPTIKPVSLIRWLVRLITPPGGTILDCFAGSGTTGEAAMLEGFDAVLIERDAQHIADIQHRIRRWSGLDAPLFAEAVA